MTGIPERVTILLRSMAMNDATLPTPGKVSIAGNIGSGKSSVARRVVELTGWPLVSTGSLFRALATRRGLTVLELNQSAGADPTIDAEIDGHLQRLAATDQHAVIDSRLAWHFVPQSFKVYLVVDPKVAVGRVHGAGRTDERYESVEKAAAEVQARQRVEGERYFDTYGVTVDDWRNYDLIVDTSRAGVDAIANLIVTHLVAGPNPDGRPICHFDPTRLIRSVDEVGRQAGTGVCIPVAVHDEQIAVVDRHDLLTAAIERQDELVCCALIAFEDEEVEAGLTATQFVAASVERAGT